MDELTLEADIRKEDSVNALFTDLAAADVQVLSLRNKTNRLEQLFMNLVKENRPS